MIVPSFAARSTCCSISRSEVRYSSTLRRSAPPSDRLSAGWCCRALRRGCSGASRSVARAPRPAPPPSDPKSRSNRPRGSEIGGSGCVSVFHDEVVGVGARVAAVAVAGLTRFFEADLERRQPGLLADRLGGDLIGGNPELEIRAGGLVDLDAGHVRAERAAVIARRRPGADGPSAWSGSRGPAGRSSPARTARGCPEACRAVLRRPASSCRMSMPLGR